MAKNSQLKHIYQHVFLIYPKGKDCTYVLILLNYGKEVFKYVWNY